MDPLPQYPTPEQPKLDPVEKSISRESAFSKPGTTKSSKATAKSKGWAPAKGTRFRATNEKRPGRRRIHPQDKRRVTFY